MADLEGIAHQHAERIAQALSDLACYSAGTPAKYELLPVEQLDITNFCPHIDIWSQQSDPHEPDFEILKYFANDEGVILDVGANAGYSVTSIRCFQKSAKVISIEPLKFLEPGFAYLKSLDPDLFDYHMVGAGSGFKSIDIFVPSLENEPVTPVARISPELYDETILAMAYCAKPETTAPLRFSRIQIDLVPLDSLCTKPFFVKIDVEGHEYEAIKGLATTLKQHKPLILIEDYKMPVEAKQLLKSTGYLYADFEAGKLCPNSGTTDAYNGFYFHSSNTGDYKDRGMFV